jgi:hypothetical protein
MWRRSFKSRRCGRTYSTIIRVERISKLGTNLGRNCSDLHDSFHRDDGGHVVLWNVGSYRSIFQLLVIANVVHSMLSLVNLMMEIRSSETSVRIRATRRNITDYGILHLWHQFSTPRAELSADTFWEASYSTLGQIISYHDWYFPWVWPAVYLHDCLVVHSLLTTFDEISFTFDSAPEKKPR